LSDLTRACLRARNTARFSAGFPTCRSGGLKPEPSGVTGVSKLAGGGCGDDDTGFPPSRERQGWIGCRCSPRTRACLRVRDTARSSSDFPICRSGGFKPEPSGVAGVSKLTGGGCGDDVTGFPPSRERQAERVSELARACLGTRNIARSSAGFPFCRSGGLKPEPSGVTGVSKLTGGGCGDDVTGFPPSRERQAEGFAKQRRVETDSRKSRKRWSMQQIRLPGARYRAGRMGVSKTPCYR